MEHTFVIKRDGRHEKFDSAKIYAAVFRAAESVHNDDTVSLLKVVKSVVDEIQERFFSNDTAPQIEDIQDMVEKYLMSERLYSVAKSYILYRDQHSRMREMKKLFALETLIDQYINLNDWMVKENSNMAYSLQGMNFYIFSAMTSRYWLTNVYPKEIREAHENADMHIHDLGMLAPYCCGWDLKALLHTGITGVPGKIESGPAKHFRSALGQVVNFFFTLQGEAAGAQAFSNFDTLLAPYVYYDQLTYKQVLQAMQEFIFNLNVSTRVGFQTPFTNITMDLIVPSNQADEYVVIGGEVKDKQYKDFQNEMDMINEAFAEVMMKGDAKGRVFTFPIPTYNITKDFDWDRPIVNKLMDMTAKYGIPYFANYVNSDMSPEDARSMCCRLRLDNRELRKRGGGLFGASPLTGSVGVVTINLPRLAYKSKTEEDFKTALKTMMDLAKESLLIKRKLIERLTQNGLFPYSRFYLSDVYKRFEEYWANHFNTIGIIGMNEAIANLFGLEESIGTEKGQLFAEDILNYMREVIQQYQEETGQMFNLEATPGEGISYRLAKIDKESYSDIITADEVVRKGEKGREPFYTNSTQLPVNYTDDVFEALDLQDKLQTKYTGGTVLHIFLGERMPSAEATKKLVHTIAHKYHLPYFSITPTFSVCPHHGYINGEHEYCPLCDEEIATEERQEAILKATA